MSDTSLRTFVFDIDGTLIDSNDAHTQAWTQALAEHEIAADSDAVRRAIGMGGDKLLPAVAGITSDSALGHAITKRKNALFKAVLPTLLPTRGARPLLEYLQSHGIALVIATSAGKAEVTALLAQADVSEFFDAAASQDDVEESKPDPDVVHAAMARVSASPNSTLMIGDTPYDIQAARQAGVDCLAFRCGGYWPDAELRGALDIFDDPAALLARLRVSELPLSSRIK